MTISDYRDNLPVNTVEMLGCQSQKIQIWGISLGFLRSFCPKILLITWNISSLEDLSLVWTIESWFRSLIWSTLTPTITQNQTKYRHSTLCPRDLYGIWSKQACLTETPGLSRRADKSVNVFAIIFTNLNP